MRDTDVEGAPELWVDVRGPSGAIFTHRRATPADLLAAVMELPDAQLIEAGVSKQAIGPKMHLNAYVKPGRSYVVVPVPTEGGTH